MRHKTEIMKELHSLLCRDVLEEKKQITNNLFLEVLIDIRDVLKDLDEGIYVQQKGVWRTN